MKFPGVKLFLSLVFLLFSFGNLSLYAKEKLPDYKGHINDFAGKLTASEIAQIEAKLKAYEDSTSVQIAVVIEGALNGNTAFDRAIEFAEGWGVGDKKNNNGVLLYLAINDTVEQRGYFTVTAQA